MLQQSGSPMERVLTGTWMFSLVNLQETGQRPQAWQRRCACMGALHGKNWLTHKASCPWGRLSAPVPG